MGHHARTLSAIIAALFATLLLSDAALAAPALVRVETPDTQSSFQAFVGRTAVDTKGPVTVTDSSNLANPTPDQLPCAADSPAAALAAVPGVSVSWLVNKAAATVVVSSIKGVKAPAAPAPDTNPPWSWIVYVDQHPVSDVCHAPVPAGSEVLFFPGCDNQTNPPSTIASQCFTGGALYLRIDKDGPYPIAPASVPVAKAPVETHVIQSTRDGTFLGPTLAASVTTDEGYRTTSNDPLKQGIATLAFTDAGPHIVRASQGGWVPVRAPVCATAGKDGFCGTVKVDPPPFLVDQFPSPCTTNGHDGFCGTTDTSGPVAHVSNIAAKQIFKKKKGPGQVKGTLDQDPNGVGDVKLRLTRVVTSKVAIKAKKKKHAKKKAKTRYRTVKTCTAWDDNKALLTTAKCGTKYGKWFVADLSDLRNEFSYSFALTLPHGTYTLEVVASDEDGYKDAPAVGRNVLVFTVL